MYFGTGDGIDLTDAKIQWWAYIRAVITSGFPKSQLVSYDMYVL